MRRVSIGISLLILMPGITQAYCDSYSSSCCCTHYSPYAFSYHSNGLVPGCVKYSSYAFGINSSGLVFSGVRYSPYAFNYHSSGLILDYCWWPTTCVVTGTPYSSDTPCREVNGTAPRRRDDPQSYRGSYSQSSHRVYGSASPNPTPRASTASPQPRQDTLLVIRQHLREQGLSNVRISRILRIDNKLVSADFTLPDRKTLIKYWDPQQVETLDARADSTHTLFERYKENWEDFAGTYQQKGGTIHHVAASDGKEIVAALDACLKPSPRDGTQERQTMYAKD
jgi:hypothetical protein